MTRTLIALLVFAMLAGATWSQDTDPQASANAQVSQKISSANQAIQKRALKRAESLLIEARKLCREKLSTSHRLYADSCRALALVYSNQKRSPKVVEPLLVDAKTTYEKTIGKSHNAYFDVLRMLGEIRLAQKRMHDAEKLFREVVSLGQSPKHQSPTIGLTCSALGRLLLRKREAKEATKFLRQAKEICGRFAGEEHIQFAICCTDLGDAYDLAGRREQALREHQIAKDIREKKIGKKDPAYIQSLVRLGLIQKELFRLKDAIDSFTEANTLIAELFGDDNPEYAKGLLRLASVYRENNDFDAAIELQRKAHRVNASALGESHLQTLTSLSEVGSSLLRANRYLQGKDLFLKLTETLKETRGEQDPNYFASNSQLARAHRELSEFEQAEKYYRITIAGYQKLYGAESKKCVDAQQGLAQTYFKMNRFEEAITLHAQVAQSRIKTLGRNHSTVLDSILYVVDCHNKLGDHAKALELAIDCGKRFEQTTGRDPNFAGSLATIGRTYYLMGNYSEAIKAYQTALSVFQDVFGDQHITYAQTNRSLAVIYQDLGDAVNASKHYVESKKAYRALKQTETNGYANLLVDYANYFRLLTKDKSKAKEILQQAIEIYEQLNKSESTAYAMALNNLAIHFQDTGDSTNAEKYFRKSMDVGRKAIGENNMQYARNQVNLGSLMLEKGDLSQAESLIESGLKTAANAGGANHIEYALFCHHLARVHHLKGDFETAAKLLDESIGIRKKHLERTATSLSARQERRYALNLLWSLDNYISVCRKRPTGAVDAYQRILEWKGASTVRQRRYRQLAAGKETAKAFAELQSVSAQLVAHYGRSTYDEDWIDQAMRLISKQEKLERTIASRSPSAHTVPTIRELQASIPKDFAMVDFFRYRDYKPDPDRPGRFDGGQRRYVAFVIHSDSPIQMIDLGSAETIDRVVKGWREPFVSAGPFINTSQPSRTHLQAARSLRELVWNPVQAALKDRQSVLLSLDGALHNIPFAALTDGPDNRYLIEDYRFVRVAAPQLLPDMLRSGKSRDAIQNHRLLAFGDVDYDAQIAPAEKQPEGISLFGIHFDRMPETEEEVDLIGSMYQKTFPDSEHTVLKADKASEAAFRSAASQYDSLYLSTHGYFADPEASKDKEKRSQFNFSFPGLSTIMTRAHQVAVDHPGVLCGVAFAGANNASHLASGDDGIITAEEISYLRLDKTDLAVLAACETGLGTVTSGEGLMGLQQAFQVAGARSVLSTTWPVGVRSTKDLMLRFYDNYLIKKMSKLDALREAQLWMMNQSSDGKLSPHIWAGFVLSGDWR